MAERRMFAKKIVLSDAFLDMPMSARCLYFTLGMLADDDGFVNAPRSIMRQCGASDDDMKLLIAKKFVLIFDSGVIVIKHWRMNNYLRGDRYTKTQYTEEKALLAVDEKGNYHMANGAALETPCEAKAVLDDEDADERTELPAWRKRRAQAYAESNLPYSFAYKMRAAFKNKPCPVCGSEMLDYDGSPHRPTIQHNIPISKGGKHELSNISIICHKCNVTLRDQATSDFNNNEVVATWKSICDGDGIPGQVYPGKDSVGKDSIGQVNNISSPLLSSARAREEISLTAWVQAGNASADWPGWTDGERMIVQGGRDG